eukprot:scaffold64938_cov69-Phaeocystis_antarctica.AAC.2
MKNVWFGSLGRGIYQGRVGCGWVGRELTGRERRAGGKASWGWAAEGAAQYIKGDAVRHNSTAAAASTVRDIFKCVVLSDTGYATFGP